MFTLSRCVIVLAILSAAVPLWAEDAEPTAVTPSPGQVADDPEGPLRLTPDQAGAIARDNADRVESARAANAADQARARAEIGVLFPQVRLDAGYTRYEGLDRPDFLASGADFDDSEDEYAATVRVDQLVWSFGRIQAALDARRALGARGQADLALAQRDAAWRARRAAVGVQFAKALRWVASERVGQRESELADAQGREDVGDVAELDVREARVELIEARNGLIAAELAVTNAYHELATALAIEDRELEVVGDLARPLELAPLIEAARLNIIAGPEIGALRARAELSTAERAALRGAALPEVGVFGQWRSSGDALDNQDDDWALGLSVSWSVWDGGTTWARSEAAARERVRLIRLADETARTRLQQFDDLAASLESLAPRITALEESVALSEQNYEDISAQYRIGLIDRVRLGQANLTVTEARLRLISLVRQEAEAAFDLMRLAE